MKKEIKGFVMGVITTTLVSTAVFATPAAKSITAFYNGIKIYVDGDKITPKDGNGTIVEPFIYDGTTYLPVRAVSEALGKQVSWDGNSNSVYIGQRLEEIVVETAEDFVKAIGSNRKIILKPGIYNLSTINQDIELQDGVTWEEVYDGKELNIRNVSNLIIEGSSEGKTEIITEPRYAQILNFEQVSNITLRNITAGHTPAEYICDAGVLSFLNSENIKISGCELYGCGSVGLSLHGVEHLNMINSYINHCSLRAIDVFDSKDINFKQCRISDHEAYSNIIFVSYSQDVNFEECEMSNNNNFRWSFMDVVGESNVVINKCKIFNNSRAKSTDQEDLLASFFSMTAFRADSIGTVLVKDTEFKNNVCDYLTDYTEAIAFENCTFSGNVWNE